MASTFRKWLNKLPPQLRPRGVRYQGISLQQSAVLKPKRIFVLPTRQGLFFIIILMVMLVGATNYGNNMIFALTFLLGSALIISILHTYRNLVGLEIKLTKINDCFAGGQANFILSLLNTSERQRYDIKILSDQGTKTHLSVRANSSNQAELSIFAAHRGRLPLGRVSIFTTFPFGLIVSWAYIDVEGSALIYPKPSESVGPLSHSPAAGEGQAVPEPGSDDFHGFREYQGGDSLRHINWKALAREQGLVTKQFQRHTTPELWFDWDSVSGNSAEERLSQLCRLILDAETRQQKYGLLMPHQKISLGRGPAHKKHCLQQLAVFELGPA